MNESEPRVTIVSAGQLSTCPRMVKAADALYAEGYRVRVVMNRRADWAWCFRHQVMGWTPPLT